MALALLAATLPVLLGLALALAPALRTATSGPWHRLVLALATAVVLLLLLPKAVMATGWPALGVFAVSFGLPLAAERLRGHPHGHDEEEGAMDVELGFAGLLLHQAIEGAEVGAVFAVGERGPALALVLALHTVPLVAAVLHACVLRAGVRGAAWRGGALLLSSASGVVLGRLAGVALEGLEPWVAAAAGGLLLHTLWHTWSDDTHRGPPAG